MVGKIVHLNILKPGPAPQKLVAPQALLQHLLLQLAAFSPGTWTKAAEHTTWNSAAMVSFFL